MSELEEILQYLQTQFPDRNMFGQGEYDSDELIALWRYGNEYGNEWQRACQDRMREIEQFRAKLQQAKDLLDQFTSLSAKAELWLGDNPASSGMTEAEYKEYLAEQDRVKRQEEEQR